MLENIQFVLINTTHPGNIGATARAMKTMGLTRLSMVNPAKFPSAEATAMASGGDDLLQRANVADSLDPVLENCSLIFGTSARPRGLAIETVDPREAALQSLAAAKEGQRVAILFGRERYGLTNDELKRCQKAVYIPSNPDFSSLNLAQAVQVLAYEVRMAVRTTEEADQPVLPQVERYRPATDQELEGMFDHLEKTLLDIEFIAPHQSRKMMLRLRRLYQRTGLDTNDINILRGIYSAMERVLERVQPRHEKPRRGE